MLILITLPGHSKVKSSLKMGLLQVLVLLTMLSVQLGQSSSLTSLVKYNIWDFIIHYSCDSGVRMSGGWVHKLYIILLGFTEQVCGCTNVVWKSNTDRSHQYWYVRNATIWATINVRIFFFFLCFQFNWTDPNRKCYYCLWLLHCPLED